MTKLYWPPIRPDEHKQLLQSVLDNPDDDTIRLIYADWIDEHWGQNEWWSIRAEVIRCQVLGKELTYRCQRWFDKLQWISNELRWCLSPSLSIKSGAFSWTPELKSCRCDFNHYDTTVLWNRGFVHHVQLRSEQWIDEYGILLQAHPIRSVVLTTIPSVEVGTYRFDRRQERTDTYILSLQTRLQWKDLETRLFIERAVSKRELLVDKDVFDEERLNRLRGDMDAYIRSYKYLSGEHGWWPKISFKVTPLGPPIGEWPDVRVE
jgi:uncharacterized protein (TIGR02996 family)